MARLDLLEGVGEAVAGGQMLPELPVELGAVLDAVVLVDERAEGGRGAPRAPLQHSVALLEVLDNHVLLGIRHHWALEKVEVLSPHNRWGFPRLSAREASPAVEPCASIGPSLSRTLPGRRG